MDLRLAAALLALFAAVAARRLPQREEPVITTLSAPLSYCSATEPCQWGVYRRSTYTYKTIPSWCRCPESHRCDFSHLDYKRKLRVYQCFDTDSQI